VRTRPYVSASFDAAGARYIANGRAHELTRIHQDLVHAYRLANSDRAGASRWPSVKALVKALTHTTRSVTPSNFYQAARLSDVTATGPMYVVGEGAPASTLELAELDDYGIVHTLTVSVGSQPHISTDPQGRV
jgi:hypothetical protein